MSEAAAVHCLTGQRERRAVQSGWEWLSLPLLETADPQIQRKKKNRDAFWRACRYLGPHRRLVLISVICAIVVGITFTSGLGTMLPVMQVLIKNGTVQDWVNRSIVEERLNVRLSTEAHEVRVVERKGDAQAGLEPGTLITLPGRDVGRPKEEAARTLELLSDPGRGSAEVLLGNAPARLQLSEVGGLHAMGRAVSQRMPVHPVKAIAVVLGVILFLALFGNAVRFFQEYLSEKAAISAVRDVRHHLYDHALHMPLSFYAQRGTSDVTSRLTSDAQNLQDGMKQLLGNSIQEPIKAAMAMGLALYVSWQLTLFIVLFGPLMFLLIKKFGKHIRRAARAAMQNTSSMLGQIDASLAGIRVVKAAGAERFERRRFRGIVKDLVREQLRIARMEAFNTPVLELLTLVVVCVIVLYAAYLVIVSGKLDNTQFFLVMACLMGIGESLRKCSKINNILQKSNAAATRLFEIIDAPIEDPRQGAERERKRVILPPMQREVAFEEITFAYPGSARPALSNVTLRVRKGESVAVVGRNGSGKTTLLSLLPRFYSPQRGRITIDGQDIADATLPSLRRQITVVTQDAVIFPGTIADNIAYGLPLAKRAEIEASAKQAFAHEFIMEKGQGYDTVLGEHGAQLSGGQKQRLCIARAILRQTPILILDEATSQVDAESEHLIQQAIEGLMHERTTFVIAHRFSTILSADRIVVMDRGEIVGEGKHQELLGNCPTYRQLYERQVFTADPEPSPA